MKQYAVVDLRGDTYLNPNVAYGDGTGMHKRTPGQITSIAIHHNAIFRQHDYDSVAQYRSEAASHYQRLGPGLQYNECIDNTGVRFLIRPETTWLYANGSAENVTAYVICLDGNFENQEPTREQLESLYQRLLELCTQRPDIPATWPNVRPHASYTATACCGANLRNRIYAIESQATAEAQLLNQGVFDWPELQPSAVIPPPPVPVDTRPEWEKNFVALDTTANMWTEGTATVIDMTTGKTISTLADNVQVEIAGKTSYAGTEMLISKYWVSRNVHTKAIPGAQLKTTPDPVVIPPTPTSPPSQADQDHQLIIENNNLLKQILALLQGLITKIGSIFK